MCKFPLAGKTLLHYYDNLDLPASIPKAHMLIVLPIQVDEGQ